MVFFHDREGFVLQEGHRFHDTFHFTKSLLINLKLM